MISKPEFVVTKSEPSDHPFIADCIHKMYEETQDLDLKGYPVLEAISERQKIGGVTMIAKTKEGENVGFMSFLFMPDILSEKLIAYGENLYVVEKYRKMGVFQLLHHETVKKAKEIQPDMAGIKFLVQKNYEVAHHIYSKFGYHKIPENVLDNEF